MQQYKYILYSTSNILIIFMYTHILLLADAGTYYLPPCPEVSASRRWWKKDGEHLQCWYQRPLTFVLFGKSVYQYKKILDSCTSKLPEHDSSCSENSFYQYKKILVLEQVAYYYKIDSCTSKLPEHDSSCSENSFYQYKKILVLEQVAYYYKIDSCTSKLPEHDSSCSEDGQSHPRPKKKRRNSKGRNQ